jgi:hypothetical protein
VVIQKYEAPAARPMPPKPVAPPLAEAAPAARGSYVATAPRPSPAPPSAQEVSAVAVVPAKLRQRVRAAAGGRALDVQVMTAPDQSVHVRVRVASYDAQAQLASRILQLPELRAPNVHLEFEVAP